MLETTNEVGTHTRRLAGLLERLEAGEQLLELDLQREAGQVRTQAEVLAVGEPEMTVGLALDVVHERIPELALVPVGRRRPHRHALALVELLAQELGVLG